MKHGLENGYLEINAEHIRGVYIISVKHYIYTRIPGMVRYFPFAEGNISVSFRKNKSKKKLDYLNELLEEHKDELIKHWKDKDYDFLKVSFKQFLEIIAMK